MREIPCRACGGARLRPESLAVTVGGLNIAELTGRSIRDTLAFTHEVDLSEREHMIAERLPGDPSGCGSSSTSGSTTSRRAGLGHACRRRGAADPARHPDRQRAGRRPVHP